MMAFKKMATGKKTVADFYADLKFKACIRHICAFEEPGDENKYKDPYTGIMVYYPFGLGAVGNLKMEDINVLRTTTNAGHWKVLPLVLNEYYIRYYVASNIFLFEDIDLARTAFDVLINIGNFEAFNEGVNKVIPDCCPDNKTVLNKNSCERLNLEIKIKKNYLFSTQTALNKHRTFRERFALGIAGHLRSKAELVRKARPKGTPKVLN